MGRFLSFGIGAACEDHLIEVSSARLGFGYRCAGRCSVVEDYIIYEKRISISVCLLDACCLSACLCVCMLTYQYLRNLPI